MDGNGIDLTQWIAPALTFLGGIAAVLITGWFTRRNTVTTTEAATEKATTEAEQSERRDTIADRDGLIETLVERLSGVEDRMETMEGEVRQVRTHNNALINFIFRCIAVLQRHDLDHEIPRPLPEGVEL